MATATSRTRLLAASALGLAAAVAGAALLTGGVASGRAARTGSPAAPRSATSAFAWLRPAGAPRDWAHITTPPGSATLFYPPAWKTLGGDPGTVTAALRDGAGRYHGYLNVTPRQGDERLATWAAFRLARNRDEGDTDVRELAQAGALPFLGAIGACVIDDYRSRVGSHPYRELACLVRGRSSTDVLIAATAQADWGMLAGDVERAAASFRER